MKNILVIQSEKRFDWKSVINHPLLINKKKKLDATFRMDVDLSKLKLDNLNFDDKRKQGEQDQFYDKFDKKIEKKENGQQLLRLTNK